MNRGLTQITDPEIVRGIVQSVILLVDFVLTTVLNLKQCCVAGEDWGIRVLRGESDTKDRWPGGPKTNLRVDPRMPSRVKKR